MRYKIQMANKAQKTETTLNDFPSDIVKQITWRLPLNESARTSILSPQWKDLWLSNPNWDLNPSTIRFEGQNGAKKFEKVVNDVISLHNGSGIEKIRICYPYRDGGLAPLTRVWMDRLATQHPLTQLIFDVRDSSPPPSSLFSCDSLVDLRLFLHRAKINVPSEVKLPNLKQLFLNGVYFSHTEEIRALLNGCRSLEVLKLEDFYSVRNGVDMEIDLPELKVFEFRSIWDFARVNLRAKKLETLEFRGVRFGVPYGFSFSEIKEVKCLEINHNAGSYWRDKWDNNLRHFGEKMSNMLHALSKTKTLVLNEWCIEYLSTIADTLELPLFHNLRQLEMSLWSNKGHMYIILYILKRSPFLQSLKLKTCQNHDLEILINLQRSEYPLPPTNLHAEIFARLTHIEMNFFRGSDFEMNIVKTLLASCPDLEQFNIKFPPFLVDQNVNEIFHPTIGAQRVNEMVREKALTFPKLSPLAELTFENPILSIPFGEGNN